MRVAIGGIRGIPARYGGFETSAAETATRLQSLGHDVSVYCRGKGAEDSETFDNVRLVHLWAPRLSSLETVFHSIFVALHVIFVDRDVEVVHLYNAASAFGGFFLHIAGKPFVITLDGVEWKREKWNRFARLIWRIATRLATRVADVTVCDSNVVRNYFENKYDTEMLYIPYGAKPIQAENELYKQFGLDDRGYLLFVGRLVPEKAVDVLLDAYRLSCCSVPLVIVGDNEKEPEYVASLRSKAVGNVHFLGFRYGAEYESLLAHARLYVSASKLEGTSPSLLAAMGAQVCCLVNGIPENRETGGDSVLYFDGSPSDLAGKLMNVLSRPCDIARYAKAGREHVRKSYDWDAVTKRYAAAYNAAMSRPPGSKTTHDAGMVPIVDSGSASIALTDAGTRR